MASKYEPLRQHLLGIPPEVAVEMSFDEIAQLVGPLPASHIYRQWWANPTAKSTAQYYGWIGSERVVASVDLPGRSVVFSPQGVLPTPKAGKSSQILDGVAALEQLGTQAGFPNSMHLVAKHTIFLDPSTVAHSRGQALFPVVRSMVLRGTFGEVLDSSGAPTSIYFDDNRTPTDGFLWSAQRTRGPDVQYNHVWTRSSDPDAYTALWNLCATPAFLAKATDGSNHPTVVAALRRRSFELFGVVPVGEPEPTTPPGFNELEWAASPPPVNDLEQTLRTRLKTSPKSPAAKVARELGWLFSDWQPDLQL